MNTYGDRVLADETRQAASAVPDGELCAVLHVRAGLFGVVAVVKPWWEKKKVTLKFSFYFKKTQHIIYTHPPEHIRICCASKLLQTSELLFLSLFF